MANKFLIIFIGIALMFFQDCTFQDSKQILEKRERSLNNNWKFFKDSLTSAENYVYDDSNWRTLDLPHDWSIEDLPDQIPDSTIGPFSKNSPGGWLTGNTMGGTGWYRKYFTLDKDDKGKLVKVLFDGVMIESDVWINGSYLGYHPNGYTAFAYDLTPFLKPVGQPNVLAVRVKNNGFTSRWYSGSGIYRNVSLLVTNPLRIDLWGVYVTNHDVSKKSATVNISLEVINASANDSDIEIKTQLIDRNGIVNGQAMKFEKIMAYDTLKSSQTITIDNPELWSVDSPNLYKILVDVISNGKLVDSYSMKTGIRSIKWDAQNGLQINDQPVKLRGGNVHHDNGLLGAAAFSRAEQRKVEILKASGYNAIRCSHNPPSTNFLEACDSLGMLVLDEAFDSWERTKVPDDYHKYFKNYWQNDLKSMLLRDRNHPSVILWSIGNEIPERADPDGLEMTRKLVDFVKEYDTTRPVTEAIQGFSGFFGGNHTSWDDSAPAFALLDIAGYNYNWREWENDHVKYPERVMLTSESSSINMYRIFSLVEKYPWVVGDFVWTAMDYLGECGCGAGYIENEEINYGVYVPQLNRGYGRAWPWYNAWCGDIDLIGNKKPRSYYRDVLWYRSQLEFAVHEPLPDVNKEVINGQGWATELPCWTWPGKEGKTLEVSVYTRCNSVRLELNGEVIGEKDISIDINENATTSLTRDAISQLVARFDVPYSPGILKAIGLIDGKEVISKVLKTTGAPDKLVLKPDHSNINADRDDLAFIGIEVTDDSGDLVPNATIPLSIIVSGNGELVAAGNGSPDQMTSFQQPNFKTFMGKALVIVRPFARPGKINITASSLGLISDTVEINVE